MASIAVATDHFGTALAISADGATLAIGAPDEDSAAVGIDGNQADNTAASAGAVYVFAYAGGWGQQAYIKASNTDAGDTFGTTLALSADGSVLAVGAPVEASAATGVNGNAADNTAAGAGAAYVFTRAGTTWTQDAYVKASNANATDNFGTTVALSNDGATLAVGAVFEQSAGRGIDADQASNTADNSGAVYVFVHAGAWTQQVYIKSSNSDASDDFGGCVALSGDGSTLAVSANAEDSAATGINGDQLDNSADAAGAAYVFDRVGAAWTQRAYVKATDTAAGAHFAVRLALSGAGDVLGVGADFAQAQVGAGYIYY
jgi:hypothetical protein